MGELTVNDLGSIDIHSIDRYHTQGYPWAEWALLREHAPAYWYERAGIAPFWAITRYDDVKRISLDDKTFINSGPRLRLAADAYEHRRLSARSKRIAARRWDPDVPEDFVFMDNPDHRDLRRLRRDDHRTAVSGSDDLRQGAAFISATGSRRRHGRRDPRPRNR